MSFPFQFNYSSFLIPLLQIEHLLYSFNDFVNVIGLLHNSSRDWLALSLNALRYYVHPL